MSAKERVYVIGGTGNIGEKVVHDLLLNGVQTTVYARSPAKVTNKHHDTSNLLTVVQGDYDDLGPFEQSIEGHTRLLLIISDYNRMVQLKTAFAKLAYQAGAKQIVDISSQTVSLGWRSTYIGATHAAAEQAILNLAGGNYVALRPAKFMTNHLWQEFHLIKYENRFEGMAAPDEKQGYISTNDIAALAAKVLQDPVEKHGDAVYEMLSCAITPEERAAAFSKVLGRTITYRQRTAEEQYRAMIDLGLPHLLAYSLTSLGKGTATLNEGLPILLGRQPETFEEWLDKNKEVFL
ncbi:hypothetical protein DFQ28_008725 [Apophysomyces sp. BC1034]|nr:hypothetical protein DFQ30_005339 [Apophysomyces sp. BC1015]KAG0174435.1 hypothetical protein DFQ29_007492 [Apophysomyces sp. BC1021]KAG0185822.1 hypothetical protein DFQ28_008725 [Apophysomyces sp. BC1034]